MDPANSSSHNMQETVIIDTILSETKLITTNPPNTSMLPCHSQSRPINPKTHDPTTLQQVNEFGYPVTNHGMPIEYYQQHPPPRPSYFESLFQPLPDNPKSLQLTLIDESAVISMGAMICCCPCVICYACVKGGKNSPTGMFCDCCNSLGKCADSASCANIDCSGPCSFIFSIAFLVTLAIIAIIILTGLVSIPVILMALPFYGMYKIYDLKIVKIIMDEELRIITVTTRRKYFKKDEIITELVISFDSLLDISIKEIQKKNFIIAKCKQDVNINFNQFNSDISEKELQKGVVYLKNYFGMRGVDAFQMNPTMVLP